MVFSSIPAYLDPANWQQQQPNYQTGSSGISLPPPPPPPPPQTHGAGGSGSIRPGSMADRARMANIPMPETALKCPRCESTNTKFCYFNNYSLSQPRHFCKTCRRYWTRGGALRTVPVGGGCRRNKRSSKASSKSPANSETASGSTSSTLPPNSTGTAGNNILGGLTSQIPQLRFMAPLSQFTDHYGTGEIGLNNYPGISSPVINLFGGGGGGGAGVEQWRLPPVQAQQFPNFLGGFDPSRQGGIVYPHYNYQGDGVNGSGSGGFVGAKLLNSSTISELASVKMEGNNNNQEHQSNFARQFFGSVQDGNEHQWGTAGTTTAWTDLSGFSSSSTSNPLQDL